MSPDQEKHVFISYVHEDSTEVDKLCKVLEASKIPYWRDRKSLGPGDAWKAKIREAIRGGSMVFLACFSDRSRAKEKSHMNEELTLAVDEFRKMPPGRTWLIPVRFDGGDVPEWDLGAGRVLGDLNYSDLFGEGYAPEAASLVTTIHNLMGDKQLGPVATLNAVEQAAAADRVELMRRLTKEMLLDPTRRIELDDLVSHEVQRILKVLNDADWATRPIGVNIEEQATRIVTEAQILIQITLPFSASLQVAARWGAPETLAPWANGLRSFVQSATRQKSGTVGLLNLRHLPGVVSVMTAALASVASGRWENLKELVAESSVIDSYSPRPLALLEAVDPYKPFGGDELTSNAVARAAQSDAQPAEVVSDLIQNRTQKFYTPIAELLHTVLRPLFEGEMPDTATYDLEFDRAEVILGVLAQDAVNMRKAVDGSTWGRSHWFGRSTWRMAASRNNPVANLQHDLSQRGAAWGPLRGDLFGGDSERASAAVEEYSALFSEIARHRSW
ncbi:TIR domain-containing protein [Microbacterium sp. LKL04]|uniref:toll/interleukin-1 receptor domain-containing protein n=1 Tax=Microbacterium sp. LKL04 TaxID=912630 RepID=UPI000875C72D|nr:toll/interleukin-1 receptor domain-containing protein [Microbacterium sp. LKL04]SCY56004.1 TIR domain-containing protein [Microbacterium sp. LKL04]